MILLYGITFLNLNDDDYGAPARRGPCRGRERVRRNGLVNRSLRRFRIVFADRNRVADIALNGGRDSAHTFFASGADGMIAGASDRYDRYGEHGLHNHPGGS